jgi:hypothetical protein
MPILDGYGVLEASSLFALLSDAGPGGFGITGSLFHLR